MKPQEKILVVRLSSGGDILQALPALALLRRKRPRAFIAFLVEDRFARLLEGRPEIDRVLVWPRSRWSRWWRTPEAVRALFELLRFGRSLARERFDLVIDLQGNLKSGLQTAFARAPKRVGFASGSSREGNRFFTNRKVVPGDESGSRVVKYVDLLRGLGIEGESPAPVELPAGALDAFEDLKKRTGLEEARFVVAHPGTSRFGAYKRWPAGSWVRLLRALGREVPVLVSWTAGDGEGIRRLAGLPGVVVPDGGLGFIELAGALGRAGAFVGTDSAPLHLAHALGCRAVGLFGPTDANLYGPFMTGEAILAELPCSPCGRRGCPGSPCMETIHPARVLEAVRRQLAARISSYPHLDEGV